MKREELKERRIAVLLGGLSAEREVSLQSGQAVLEALRGRGYHAIPVDVDEAVCRRLIEAQIEVAFIALHGRWGEDGCIQGLLESLAIPYTGSGVLASALAMDKVTAKRLFDAARIPTAPWAFPVTAEAVRALGLPVVVKPRGEGSSVGMSVVRAEPEIGGALERAGAPFGALCERYVKGRELSVAVLGEGATARVLGSVEIRPADGIYDYQAKYAREDTQYLVPAPVAAPIAARIGELALGVHRLLECSGATRTDFLWDGAGEPIVLELNTLPGMTGHSLLPKIAAHAGLSYADLVETIALDASLKQGVSPQGALQG
jgi:D-alanine-D-alanine ligase